MKFRGRGEHRLPELEMRARATEKTRDRFFGKRFDWSTGGTCVHMARYHLRNMGHRPPGLPRFRSLFAAKQALRARGWASVAEMLDAVIGSHRRVYPAAMGLGDIVKRGRA